MSASEPTTEPAGMAEPTGTAEPPAHADAGGHSAAAEAEADADAEDATAPSPEDLRAAAGLGERPARGSKRTDARRRRTTLITAAALLLAAAVASLVYLGQQNRRSYHLVCGAGEITAAQGRGFPPWGRSALTGDAWRPIPVAPSMPCTSQTTGSRAALARRLGEMLVARADAWVIGRPDGTGREQLANVQAELDQARLLLGEAAESGDAAAADGAGRAIERLQGDVDYWRARDRVEAAMAAVDEATAQLDQAVAREPRHNGEDAVAWQRWLARIRQDLTSGPRAAPRGAAEPGAARDAASSPAASSATDVPTPSAPGSAPGVPGPAQDSLAPPSDAGAATPDAGADPTLPAAQGTPVPPAAPRKAPASTVPRGGQLI